MPNGYFNGQVRTSLKGGKVADTDQRGGASPGLKMKPGFATGVPGKTQPKDRSGGVKRAKVRPADEGL